VLFAHHDAGRRPVLGVISSDLDDPRIGLTTSADVITTVDALLAAMLEVVRSPSWRRLEPCLLSDTRT
jgi:hypothetical protein